MTTVPSLTPDDVKPEAQGDENSMSPLPGEPGIPNIASAQSRSVSKKGLLALILFLASLVAISAVGIQRFAASWKKAEPDTPRTGDKPSAATMEPRKLDIDHLAPTTTASTTPRVPALEPDDDEVAQAIGVRRTGGAAPPRSNSKQTAPEDAPILLVSTRPLGSRTSKQTHRAPVNDGVEESETHPGDLDPADPLAATTRNLEIYQRQLQGLLNDLARTSDLTGAAGSPSRPATALLSGPSVGGLTQHEGQAQTSGMFGNQLQSTATSRVKANTLGNRSLILPKGTAFTCALKTRLISAGSGLVGCQVQRNVFSDDGRVLLVERGSHLDGEYRMTSARPGMVRIPVLWTRLRTPLGVVVDIDSPATGSLGESGVEGHVDKRWTERIGAAMLLSLIDDSVKLVIQNQTNEREGNTIVLPSTTANTSQLAEKVLDSTINIPPLVYQNQGGIVGIYVARDVDFSNVYDLRPTAR